MIVASCIAIFLTVAGLHLWLGIKAAQRDLPPLISQIDIEREARRNMETSLGFVDDH